MSAEILLPQLSPDPKDGFPQTTEALRDPNGLLAFGGGLEPERLLRAYQAGIFPWYEQGQPILWWSPAPRCVIFPGALHLSRRLKRRLKQQRYTISVDQAFTEVIEACGQSRQSDSETWITSEMESAYVQLHELGHAHSIEVWQEERLVGGLYGLSQGRVFFGESMFSVIPDASKIALAYLCRQLQNWEFHFLDCQISNPHLRRMGAVELTRHEFEQELRIGVSKSAPKHWATDFLCTYEPGFAMLCSTESVGHAGK